MPERVIESLGVMGWGVGVWGEFFRRHRRRHRRPAPNVGGSGKTVSSRLSLRTEISARYYRQATGTDVPHLFCFHEKCEKYVEPRRAEQTYRGANG